MQADRHEEGIVAMSAYLGVLIFGSAIGVGSIWMTCARYLPQARQLRHQMAPCPATRELRFTIVNVEVERVSAVIHRPVFNPQKLALPPRVSRRAA